ncbi:MAG: amino acid permease [Bacteroidia bacterium]|nr:amino acid permease [Bacteroidia bacterium]MCX7652216.1 amino acid permease [Bacteroidia bacterium]MDW8416478.1 amino acid permease [Bacteroidia bacterium]
MSVLFRRKPLSDPDTPKLKRILSVLDLTAIGVAAIIGAGIFSTIGEASAKAGPAVTLVFVIGAIVAGLSALSYAEMASSVPLSGSAYTYTYVVFGEIVAWAVGWMLVLEYAVGNIAVAISWSGYFQALLGSWGIPLPQYLVQDPLSLWREAQQFSATGDITFRPAYEAWQAAPRILGIPIVMNLPALLITAVITLIAYIGIKESRTANNLMVAIKVGAVLLVLGVGAFFVDPERWQNFMPNGFTQTMRSVGAVFFAYIGFDALSTTAEEAQNPKRDLPLAMILSLAICTLLYIGIALVLTGLVPYQELSIPDPLAYVFGKLPLSPTLRQVLTGVIAISAVVAMASVLLVFQIGQPRIWYAMSRDGLLPPALGKVHPRFKTPHVSTILTGLVVAVPLFFSSLHAVVDMTSMGTLMAFAVVSAGVAYLHHAPPPGYAPRFRVPKIPGRWPFLVMLSMSLIWSYHVNPESLAALIDPTRGGEIWRYRILLLLLIPFGYFTVRYNLSLLPMLGMFSALYLIVELGTENWLRLGVWLLVGLVLYFAYGYWHSSLRWGNKQTPPPLNT